MFGDRPIGLESLRELGITVPAPDRLLMAAEDGPSKIG